MRAMIWGGAALAGCAMLLHGQSTTGKAVGSTVSGRVFLEDTNGPARIATVTLQSADAVDAIRGDKPRGTMSATSVQTLLDGSYTIPNVQPGTYYVIASAPGYISPINAMMAPGNEQPPGDATQDQGARKKLAALAPRVTVQANLPASANITLERGGAVSGTVLYDDGSPAAGLRVELLEHRSGKWASVPRMGFDAAISSATTDDRGNYRISGLPAREYAVEVNLQLSKWLYSTDAHGNSSATSNTVYSFAVYSGNAMREKDAKGFSLSAGEDRGGEDIEIPVSRLHTVRGNVTAAHDGHLINGGRVSLLYSDDKTEVSSTQVTSDAEFNFSFVPEGDYLLRVENAADTEYTEIQNPAGMMPPTHTETKVLHKYGTAEVPIHIGSDLTGVVIAAPDGKPTVSQ